MSDTLLRTGLLDLLDALGDEAPEVLLAGGYGLYLKQLHRAATDQRTLFQAESWPAPRATQDLDLMLTAELVADPDSMRKLRRALDELGYTTVKGAEHMQFARTVDETRSIKIDLLTAQRSTLADSPGIRADSRRASPAAMDRPKLHAHPTDGALTLAESPLVIDLAGTLSDGRACARTIGIPNAFCYLLMKLTAYRDRRDDIEKDLGRHHALDMFRIVAMLTEPELGQVEAGLRRFGTDEQVVSCMALLRSDFSAPVARGILAMREHPLWSNDAELPDFLALVRELSS